MNKSEKKPGFEQKLQMLEELVNRMGEGGLSLEELLKEYEFGVKLAQDLQCDLEKAQAKILTLQGGVLKPMENADAI